MPYQLTLRPKTSGPLASESLRHQLLGLIFERVGSLIQLLSSALVFGERDNATQVGFRQTIELLLKAGLATAQVFLACLQLLR